MNWIAQNISQQSIDNASQNRILVSMGDSGQFVSAVTQQPTLSQKSFSKNSLIISEKSVEEDYCVLMTLLSSNASDVGVVPLMIKNNITYVFIGSNPVTYDLQSPYRWHFNASELISSPYFSIEHQAGNAWLFKFNASEAETTQQDGLCSEAHREFP